MSGAASGFGEGRPGPRRGSPDDIVLFEGLVVSNPPPRRRGVALPVSLAGHGIIIALLVLTPILWPSASPETPDIVARLIYNPPPPPPPPLPKGSALVETAKRAQPVTAETPKEEPKFTADIPQETRLLEPEARAPESEQAGSPTGSDIGVPEGMEEGVEGGVVGGVPGGVIGGVIGGTGTGAVMDYDSPPRPIRITQPKYPQEAFVKKIEGVVELEILIDSTGQVVNARVVRSIPLLDAAAIQTVMQWRFSPAVKGGRAVATIARAPVTFRIL